MTAANAILTALGCVGVGLILVSCGMWGAVQ